MKKLKSFAIALLIIMLVLPTRVTFATEAPCTISLNGSNEFRAGDTINISVQVSDLTVDKITGLQGLLKYDKNVFEPVSKASISGMTVTQFVSNAQGDVIMIVDASNAVTSNGGTIVTIPFKVKADPVLTGNTTTIEISGAKVTEGSSTAKPITIPAKVLTLVTAVAPTPTPTPVPTPTPTPTPKPTATPTPTAKPSATPTPTVKPSATPSPSPITPVAGTPTKTPTPKATEKPALNSNGQEMLPQTGTVAKTGFIILTIAVVAIGGVSFYKYKKYNDITK